MSNNAPTVTQRRSSQRLQERRSSSNDQDSPHSHSPSSSKSGQQHSESDSSSLPDISQAVGKEQQRTCLVPEDEGVEDEDEVKSEEGDGMDVEELSHSDGRGDAGPVRLSDSASATLSSQGTPNPSQSSTPTASLKPAKPTPKKRRREDVDEVIELPQVSASQPPSSSKRAHLSAPSASQPVTPAQKDGSRGSFKVPAPPSTSRAKAKAAAPPRKRSANFWHLDGSVVVQVQNTLFRLHRSRLAQQSDYFAKLFQNNDGSVQQDIVDSCPVYVAKGVSVLDFERLLTAQDAGISYAVNPPSFNVIASLLRAAHALSFRTILEFATHSLRESWTSDLDEIADYDVDEVEERVSEATQTIILAQKCNLPELLKGAYYEILRSPDFGQDLSGYVYAESNDTHPHDSELVRLRWETEEDEENAPSARLAASDFVRLVRAKTALQSEWLKLARGPPLPSTMPCPLAKLPAASCDAMQRDAKERCALALKTDQKAWAARLLETEVFDIGLEDVFDGIQRLIDVDWMGRGYCVGCVSERRDMWKETRQKLWKKLDVLLGLKGEDEE
ncbi:hypothetical protein ONZ51_g12060 [Trametes cubensis]|uniref:BTB domain-containing protein n=1 Tax=Trametes cubensis TaxID=1111947 RepID=A0AAD7X792_9APHY|nr:hypothetical protein ONZ51_g12060 [Trametes cubensis]